MKMFEGNPFAELEQKKKSHHEKVASLLHGTPLVEIARILDAEEFVQMVQLENHAPVKRFDIDGFVERELKRDDALLLPDSFTKLKTTVLPPDDSEVILAGNNGGGLREKKTIPRSRYLAEVLTDLRQPYSVITGTNKANMMRGESYQVFIVPGLERAVLLNDEEGNATFVFSSADPVEVSWLITQTKNELKSLGDEKIRSLNYPGDSEKWKSELFVLLQEPFVRLSEKRHVTQEINNELATAPSGWMNELDLIQRLGIGRGRTTALIRRYLNDHPEWSELFKNEKNRTVRYYHPELIMACQSSISSLPIAAPTGWKMNVELADELGVNKQTTQRLIDAYLATHPDWIARYCRPDGQVSLYASPELSRLIAENIGQRVPPPAGWKIAMQLTDASRSVRRPRILEIAERFREEHPEWFSYFANQKRVLEEHYHPELVRRIEEELSKRPEKAPDGWATVGSLAKSLRVDSSTIERIVDRYAKERPEWLEIYGGIAGSRTHLHPELVELVHREIKTREKAPEGWMGWTSVANEAGVDPATVRLLVERRFVEYRSRPEYFGAYLNANGKQTDFLSPSFMKLIVTELGKRETAPIGWATVLGISSELKEEVQSTGRIIVTDRKAIKKMIEEYRANNPDWFKEYKTLSLQKHVFTEHYHPELVRMVKERLRRS